MDEIKFLVEMLSYEIIDKACKAKKNLIKGTRRSQKTRLENPSSKKQGYHSDEPGKGKYCGSSSSTRKTKKIFNIEKIAMENIELVTLRNVS